MKISQKPMIYMVLMMWGKHGLKMASTNTSNFN